MAVILGDTGKMATSNLKQSTITYPSVARELTAMGLTLPTAEGTPQISFTVQESDIPTFTGLQPLSAQYIPFIWASGKIGASATTLNYKVFVNGSLKYNSSNTNQTANNYYTYNFCNNISVSVGDVITVGLWANQADTTLVYAAFMIGLSRLQFSKAGTIIRDVSISPIAFPGNNGSVGTVFPNSPTPNFSSATPSNMFFYLHSIAQAQTGSAFTLPVWIPTSALYYMFRSNQGDVSATQIYLHASNQFGCNNRTYLPTSISFREVLR